MVERPFPWAQCNDAAMQGVQVSLRKPPTPACPCSLSGSLRTLRIRTRRQQAPGRASVLGYASAASQEKAFGRVH
jgi:hypothetical protein